MRLLSLLCPLLLASPLAAAQTAPASQITAPQGHNPAPMNGLWQLTGYSDSAAPTVGAVGARPGGELVIVSGAVRGNAACARFQGTLTAERNEARVHTEQLPPPANVRCAFTVRGSLGTALNEVRQYTLSRSHLVLFSDKVRLTFERAGYVTPARK